MITVGNETEEFVLFMKSANPNVIINPKVSLLCWNNSINGVRCIESKPSCFLWNENLQRLKEDKSFVHYPHENKT